MGEAFEIFLQIMEQARPLEFALFFKVQLGKLGADVTEGSDSLTVNGGKQLNGSGVIIEGCNDHRIVMSAAVASMICKGTITITDAEAISKSYPEFWNDFRTCGAEINN